MGLNYDKLDKLAAILTFLSVLLVYFAFTVGILLIVAGICWLFHFNFKLVGKVIYILWTILFLYIVWNDWDDYYAYSRKVVYRDFAHLVENGEDKSKSSKGEKDENTEK